MTAHNRIIKLERFPINICWVSSYEITNRYIPASAAFISETVYAFDLLNYVYYMTASLLLSGKSIERIY